MLKQWTCMLVVIHGFAKAAVVAPAVARTSNGVHDSPRNINASESGKPRFKLQHAHSLCLIALQNACPFSVGKECFVCVQKPSPMNPYAMCSTSEVTSYCNNVAPAVTHWTVALSEPRRDIGGTSVSEAAVFAGGCQNAGTGTEQYSCNDPSGAVDIFRVNSAGNISRSAAESLDEPRGWICASAARDGESVLAVLAGGGTSGTIPHSTAADVLDLSSGAMKHFPHALSVGRWGLGCTEVAGSAYFAGGKVTVSGYDNARMTNAVDVFTPGIGWAPAPYNLSVARESTTAAAIGGSLLVAGGWKKVNGKYMGDNTVDLFENPVTGRPADNFALAVDGYDVGVAVVDKTAYVVGNENVYAYTASGASKSWPLPQALVGGPSLDSGGAIPGSHIQQNGIGVGKFACFYGGTSNASQLSPALYCLNTATMRWSRLQCTTAHRGGAIAAVGGSTILIAGGFDPLVDNAPATDVVDVFKFTMAGESHVDQNQ